MIHSHTTPPPDNSIPVDIPPSGDPETEIPRNAAKYPKHLTRNRTIPLSDFQDCGTSHETQWNLPEIHFPLEGRKLSYCTKFKSTSIRRGQSTPGKWLSPTVPLPVFSCTLCGRRTPSSAFQPSGTFSGSEDGG